MGDTPCCATGDRATFQVQLDQPSFQDYVSRTVGVPGEGDQTVRYFFLVASSMTLLHSLTQIPKQTITPLWETYYSWRTARNCRSVLRAMLRGRLTMLHDIALTANLSEEDTLRILRILRPQDKVAPIHVDHVPDESLWVKL